jgi:APA family basic amino acid/polyamine antiporter
MSANRDLPAFLAEVHPRYRTPHRAELAVGLIVAGIAAVADIRSAISFSSFAVLWYYAIANAAAWTLSREQRRWPHALSGFGLLGCLALAFTLPLASVIGGALLLASGAAVHLLMRRAGAERG